MTKPSRFLSNGREARSGSSLRVLRAFMLANPQRPIGRMVASAPPQMKPSASPNLMMRQASPMLWLEVAQAVTMAMFGPMQAEFHGNDAAGDVGNHHRNGERRDALGSLVQVGAVFAFQRGQSRRCRCRPSRRSGAGRWPASRVPNPPSPSSRRPRQTARSGPRAARPWAR